MEETNFPYRRITNCMYVYVHACLSPSSLECGFNDSLLKKRVQKDKNNTFYSGEIWQILPVVGRISTAPPPHTHNCSCPNPWNLQIYYSTWQRGVANQMTFIQEDYPGLTGWVQYSQESLNRKGKTSQSEADMTKEAVSEGCNVGRTQPAVAD